MKKYKKIYIEITNNCNLSCSFCSQDKRPKKNMTKEEFEEILKNPNHGQDALKALIYFGGFEIACITGLTIITSIIGVGTSLMDDIHENLSSKLCFPRKKLLSAMIIVMPTTIFADTYTQAFVTILSFAGCILSIIAIFIPLFLLTKAKTPFVFSELNRKWFRKLLFLFGVLIVLSECLHVFKA